jgi:hypothetical protein
MQPLVSCQSHGEITSLLSKIENPIKQLPIQGRKSINSLSATSDTDTMKITAGALTPAIRRVCPPRRTNALSHKRVDEKTSTEPTLPLVCCYEIEGAEEETKKAFIRCQIWAKVPQLNQKFLTSVTT